MNHLTAAWRRLAFLVTERSADGVLNTAHFPGSRLLEIGPSGLQFSLGCSEDSRGATIHAVFVPLPSRRRGVGTELLDALAVKFMGHAIDPDSRNLPRRRDARKRHGLPIQGGRKRHRRRGPLPLA